MISNSKRHSKVISKPQNLLKNSHCLKQFLKFKRNKSRTNKETKNNFESHTKYISDTKRNLKVKTFSTKFYLKFSQKQRVRREIIIQETD